MYVTIFSDLERLSELSLLLMTLKVTENCHLLMWWLGENYFIFLNFVTQCSCVQYLDCGASLHVAFWQFDSLTQRGREWGQDGMETQVWDGACMWVGGCSLVTAVPGNKAAAYFPQIADLSELPGDTFQEPWMTVIVRRPGPQPEQTGLHQFCFWEGQLAWLLSISL